MNSIEIKKTIKDYKNLRASRYIPVRGDEIRTRVFELDKYYISTKIDGHLCFLINYKDNKLICNYNGNTFNRNELLEEFLKTVGDNEGVLVGEIFSYKENDRTRSFELKKDLSDKKSDIRIGVFDIIESQNETFSENDWIRKKKILNSVFSKSELIFAVKELELKSRKDIQNEFNSRVNEKNEEGLIVRGESGPVFKIKPTLNFDFVIMGYVVGYTDDPTLLKELLFGVNLEKDKFLIIGKVSSGFSIDDRKKMVSKFEKIQVDANIIEVSGSKIPFTMVDPIHVAEIDAIDIINSSNIGIWDINQRAVLDYNLLNTQRLNGAHILDVRIDKKWFFKSWSINAYIDIENILNSKRELPSQYGIDSNLGDLVDGTDGNLDSYPLYEIINNSGNLLPSIGLLIEF